MTPEMEAVWKRAVELTSLLTLNSDVVELVKQAVEEEREKLLREYGTRIAALEVELERLRGIVAATGRSTAMTWSAGALTPRKVKSKRGGEEGK